MVSMTDFRKLKEWMSRPRLAAPLYGVTILIGFLFALLLHPGSAFAQGNSALLLTTITNPAPTNLDQFGLSVAAIGNDRVLVGTSGAGQVYMFSLNGTLLTTFSISDPLAGSFGAALTAVGSDRVLIGAYGYFDAGGSVGRAYLFSTNNTLLTTFTNPSPTTVIFFGLSLAAVGSDCVLIGGKANTDNPPPYVGSVYLFNTNGALLTAFTNPTPAYDNGFGYSAAAVGSDRVLISAYADNTGAASAGAVYLFNTNGALLTTFTNPTPEVNDDFGAAVATVGSDRVLVGAYADNTGASHAGSAYLFGTNGTLLTTFTNPVPTPFAFFGYSATAVGSTRVLIGAYQDNTGASHAGSAYLFSTNGTLLNTFTNPTPEVEDRFGYAVAAVGTDRVIISAIFDNTGASFTGSAYLYALPYPLLSITRNASAVSLNWVTPETGLTLQQTPLLAPASWSDTADSVSINGTTNVVQQTIAGGRTNRFYRLRRP